MKSENNPKQSLKDIAGAIVDCEHKTAPTQEFGIPLIRTTDIHNGRLDLNKANRISEDTYRIWSARMTPKPEDIILAREAPVGEVGMVPPNEMVCLGQRTVLIRIDKRKADPKFVLYLLCSPEMKYEMISRASGSVVPHLNMSDVRTLPLPELPDKLKQEQIGNILGTLDDKISLNSKMNKTLEAIGQTIFKHWFTDFEFPNEEGKSYRSSGGEMTYNEELEKEIPKGWIVEDLGELIVRNRDKIDNKKNWENENIIDLSTMPQFSICLSSFQEGKKFDSNVFRLNEMDILFGSIRSYFGKVGFSPIYGVVTGTIFSYLPKTKNHYAFVLFLTSSREFIDFTVRFSKGTKMPVISWDDFCSYKIVIPPNDDIFASHNQITMSLLDKIKSNIHQSRNLIQIRDLLLPKFMSGKISVPVEAN
jgi:type I restriction enzyme S subunit